MIPALHVRIYTQAASWLRAQARTNRRSVGAETQFVVEQAMVRAELVERASVAVKLSRGEIARCKKYLGKKVKPVGWSKEVFVGATKVKLSGVSPGSPDAAPR